LASLLGLLGFFRPLRAFGSRVEQSVVDFRENSEADSLLASGNGLGPLGRCFRLEVASFVQGLSGATWRASHRGGLIAVGVSHNLASWGTSMLRDLEVGSVVGAVARGRRALPSFHRARIALGNVDIVPRFGRGSRFGIFLHDKEKCVEFTVM
jgi:hypothetical protein